ncbi:MAG: type IV pilin protein [Rhizobacter sp.]
MRTHTAQHGFTLIETLAAMAIAAVLSGIAVPSFDAHLRKARRADALTAVAQIQGAQERLRSRSTRYGDLTEVGAASVSAAGHYSLQISAFTAEGYELIVTATGPQARDADCRVMRARAVGMNLVYESGTDARVANDATTNRRCWSL